MASLVLTDEQILLKDTARRFFTEKAPVSELRKLRDEKDADGFSRALWAEMAEQGWAGVAIPEVYGGLEFGHVGLGLVLEESGRTLTASPLVSTVLVGANIMTLGANDMQRQFMLPDLAQGKLLMALALEETYHHSPTHIETRAEKVNAGYTLNGKKIFVLDGHVADQLIVAARTSGEANDQDGISLFMVEGDAAGITRTRTTMVDSRNAAHITFKDVYVGDNALIGGLDKGSEVLSKALDRASIGLAAEMLGSMQEAFDRTMAYIKQRVQFGEAIGSFQALQHRAADMFCEIELCKSVVLQALVAIDEDSEHVSQLASLAKARVSDTFKRVALEAVQMHGGIGMTDEEEIGFFLKRATVAQETFGDSDYHANRYAELGDY